MNEAPGVARIWLNSKFNGILERFSSVFMSCFRVEKFGFIIIFFFYIILMHHLPPSDISPVRIEVIGGMFLKASGN